MSEKQKAVYCLYGRKSYTKPLAFVKRVPQAEINSAATANDDWVELVAFPETAAIQVIPGEKNHDN